MFFIPLVLIPVLKQYASSPREFAQLMEKVGRRFQAISWEAIGIIIFTGIFNLVNTAIALGFNFSATYIKILVVKLVLVVVIIVNQALHSFVIAPKLVSMVSSSDQEASQLPDSFVKLRRRSILFSILNLIFAVVVILLGLMLGNV